jgi:hypothetical protein
MLRLNQDKRAAQQVFVNPVFIESLSVSDTGETYVRTVSGDLLSVSESPNQVAAMIEAWLAEE